jgi:hypothetical protein
LSFGPRGPKPLPRSLAAIAEIAASLATGESVGAVMPGILAAVATALDGAHASLWLRGVDGLRRAWTTANDPTTAAVVEAQLALTVFEEGFVPVGAHGAHQRFE